MARIDLPPRPTREFTPQRQLLQGEIGTSGGPFFRALLVGALGLSVGLLIAAVSARQVSQRDDAQPRLEAMVESLTDPAPLLAAELQSLRSRAEAAPSEPVIVPGFPLDITFTSEEVRTLDAAALADLAVTRGAARLYDDGMGALDQTGNQDAGIFSAQGIVRRVGDRLTGDAHDSANKWSLVFLVAAAGLAVLVVLAYREERRLRAVGVGVILGSLAGLLVTVGLDFIAERAGSHDPFVEDVRTIVQDVLAVPRRNFLIGGFLGVSLSAASIVLGLAKRLQPIGEAAFDDLSDEGPLRND